MIPVITYLVLISLGVYWYFTDNTPTYYNWKKGLINAALPQGLYIWAGFYENIDIPQVLVLGVSIFHIFINCIKHNELYIKSSFSNFLIVNIAYNTVLFWGGFFNVLF